MLQTPAILLIAAPMLLFSQQPDSERKADQLDTPRSSIPGLQPSLVWGQSFEPMTTRDKLGDQVYGALGPWSVGTALASSAINQWQNDPAEWGQGWDAFGQRFASNMGTRLVRRSIRFGLSAIRSEDPRYFRSGETGAWKRLKNQLKQTVVTRTDSGGVTFASGRVIGTLAASQMAQLWEPDSRGGVGVNFRRGGTVLAGDLGARILREFWPEIRKRLRRKP